MFKQIYTTKFSKDLIKALKRGKNINKIKQVLEMLAAGKILDPKYKDHNLVGNYSGRRECHIEPDWLLIYKIDKDQIIFERTGTHSDLF